MWDKVALVALRWTEVARLLGQPIGLLQAVSEERSWAIMGSAQRQVADAH